MLLCAAGWDCGYNRQEKWAKVGIDMTANITQSDTLNYSQVILVGNMVVLALALVSLVGLVVWDLTSGHQTLTGSCVWTRGYCLWIG